MTDLNQQLVSILSKIKRPGSFYASGTVGFQFPKIEVDGVGLIALPLLPLQARQLASAGIQAPYGKGEDTLLDTDVRNTLQIDANQVHISGKHWQAMLDDIVGQVAKNLSVTGTVTAELYKMLLYEEGGFFIDHRDTEKSPGMFASLIISLPSEYSGGELRIKHAGQEVTLDLHAEDFSELPFAAFYADCVHEVLPVTQGYRAVLAYNLCRSSGSEIPQPPNYLTEQEQLVNVLNNWTDQEHNNEDIPLKQVYLLEHAYTPASLSFSALKNGDAAIADTLKKAAEQADCDCYLALVSVEESGSAENHGGYYGNSRYRRGYDEEDDDDFEIEEVFNESQFISNWIAADGTVAALEDLPFEDDELCLPHRLRTLEPDELHFHEATGNEGASFERAYRRAALVIWPRKYSADALMAGGVNKVIPYLKGKVDQWCHSGSQPDSPLREESIQLVNTLIKYWPEASGVRWHPSVESTLLGAFLSPLLLLQDSEYTELAIREIAVTGKAYKNEDNPPLIQAFALLPPQTSRDLLLELAENQVATQLTAISDLLHQLLPVYAAKHYHLFHSVAEQLLNHLPDELPKPSYWNKPKPPYSAQQVTDILFVTGSIDDVIGGEVITNMLSKPRTFPMDSVLIPAVLQMAQSADFPEKTQLSLYQACLEHLEKCIAEPLAAPQDWTREVNFKYTDRETDCKALEEFLNDPEQESWSFKAAQARRDNLSGTALQSFSDVKMETIKKGSPHILFFTKTDASYQKRVKQRQLDEKNIKLLRALKI